MSLSLSVQFASRASHVPARSQVRRWASAAHSLATEQGATITIRYVDEKEGRSLNCDFRGKDYATNVLTFVDTSDPQPLPALHESASPGAKQNQPRVHADIAICAPVVAREAKSQKKTVHAHHAHMVVHGMLHALGFDHENETDAHEMEALEVRVLQRFRINNPYE